MPPLCSEKRCPQNIGRRRRVSSISARPTLLIRENLAAGDDEAEESDENISPDADKSGIRFALETKRDDDGDDNDNRDGQSRDSGNSDNNGGGQNGREGGSRNGRPPFFHENDNGGRRFGADSDGGENGGGGKEGDNSDSGNDGNGGGGGDDNGDGKDGNDNGDSKGKGRGSGGDSGNDHGGSKSSSNDNSPTTSPSPPPPSTTSTASTVLTSTTTPVVISTTSAASITSVPTTETTASSTSQESTTTVIAPIPLLTPNISPTSIAGEGVDTPQSSTSLPPFFPESSIPAPVPTQTNNRGGGHHNGNDSNGNNRNNNNNNNGGNGSRLSKTSEEILVAAGALGVFIVLCFLLWLIYRSVKKSQQSGRKYNRSPWLARLIPWAEKPETNDTKVLNGVYNSTESLPAYDAGNKNSIEAYGYYDQRKLDLLETENMAYPPAAAMPRNEMAMRQTADGQQQLPRSNSLNRYPQLNGEIIDSNDADSTLRSRMPDPYYNQSEFARQPSDAYNPAQRRVYRASEISSLSSGFGDGDIIMPPPNVMVPKTPTATRAITNADSGNGNNTHPFSWMSRAGPEQQRDTVYTTTSDRRTRFRSVNSWVDQQMRRVKKAS
ncbi:hypothetical protein F5Y03DRAFT_337445 [Xylaria venustula]|nr:hypothetical protein F5Y03DRAFT_337445 [Xylaria venustula]